MGSFFTNIISFTGSPDIWTVLLLLAWCLIGEVGISIPYVLESFWLLVGFHVGSGTLSPGFLIALWLASQAGRQAGSFGLYRIACFGMPALEKLFHKVHLDKLFDKIKNKSNAAGKVNLVSPFTVAFGRMFAMRIPMIMVCAAKRKWSTLSLGVLISSVIWDALYISLGAIFGSTVHIAPVYMLLISIGTMGLIYGATYGVKRLIKYFRHTEPATVITTAPQIANPPLLTQKSKVAQDSKGKVFRQLQTRFFATLKLATVLLLFPGVIFNRFGEKLR